MLAGSEITLRVSGGLSGANVKTPETYALDAEFGIVGLAVDFSQDSITLSEVHISLPAIICFRSYPQQARASQETMRADNVLGFLEDLLWGNRKFKRGFFRNG